MPKKEVIWIEARPLSIRFVPQESHSQAGSTRLRHKLEKKHLIVALAAVGEQIMINTLPLQYVLP